MHAVFSDYLKIEMCECKVCAMVVKGGSTRNSVAKCFEKSTEDPTLLETIGTGDET